MPEFTQLTSFIKICGVTSMPDAQMVIDAGADALGLIMADSSRRLNVEEAAEISQAIKGSILRVGVFRHNADDFVLGAVDSTDVDVVQVHGTLSKELLEALRLRGVAVVKALSVGAEEFGVFDEMSADALLIDGPAPGSGEVHAWHDLANRGFKRPYVAAGGLTPDNVVDVLTETGAWGADVSSGVESSSRKKDASRVRDFVTNARAYFAQREESRG